MKSASYEYRNKSARRRAQFVPMGMPTVLKTFTKHNKYAVNQKLEHVDNISFIEFIGRISVLFTK